jgi:tRNA-specific 2-thiouridylase
MLREVNWLGDEKADALRPGPKDILARLRSSGPLQPATLRFEDDGATVELAHGEDGVSPGQACVLYDAEGGERLLGGGWIKSAASSAWVAKDGFKVPASSGAESAFVAGSR